MLSGTQSEFSRWLGCSPAAVIKFKKAGKLVFISEKIIDFEASKKLLADTAEKYGTTLDHAAKKGIEPNISESGQEFQKSKAKKEYYKALQAKADYEQSIGDLVSRDEVNRSMTAAGIIIRESFQRMPDFLSEELFAAESAEQIKEILEAHINELLEQAAENLGKYE